MRIKKLLLVAVMMFGLVAPGVLVAESVSAAKCSTPQECASQGSKDANSGSDSAKVDTQIKDIVNILLYVTGAIAVLMIIIGGLRYVLSGGDSSSTKAAKDTVLYAVVGLVVAILAYAIVNWVLAAFA